MMTKHSIPLVSICCIAYNQENYIRDTIGGFLMQKTNFPIEIIIHDDASTDGTASIIQDYEKEYPELFVTILQKKNQWSEGGGSIFARFVFPRAQGKYVALCEGDDYWTDPLKLQKQVDFLELNQNHGLIHSDHDVYFDRRKVLKKDCKKEFGLAKITTFEDLLHSNWISTLTTVMRADVLNQAIKKNAKYNAGWKMGDYPLWLEISKHSKIKFLNDNTAVYRVLDNSASNTNTYTHKLNFLDSTYIIKQSFISRYGCSEELKVEIDKKYHKEKLRLAFYHRKHSIAQENYKILVKMGKVSFIEQLFFLGSFNKLTFLIARGIKKVFKVIG